MNKTEFINELKDRLRRLPQEEVDNAISYYEEYFNEAGEENESQTIKALGTPAAVASKIIGEYAVKDTRETKSSGLSPLWITVLAVLASPIALPLMIVPIALVFAMVMVVFALVVSGGAIVVAGVAITIVAVRAFTFGFATGIFYLGCGLVSIGTGTAMVMVFFKMGQVVFYGLQRWLGKLLIKRGTQ